jgi:hypothetical protein
MPGQPTPNSGIHTGIATNCPAGEQRTVPTERAADITDWPRRCAALAKPALDQLPGLGDQPEHPQIRA